MDIFAENSPRLYIRHTFLSITHAERRILGLTINSIAHRKTNWIQADPNQLTCQNSKPPKNEERRLSLIPKDTILDHRQIN